MDRSKREFGEGPIYTITNYIYWFLLGNIYFWILNIPLLSIIAVVLYKGINEIPNGFYFVIFICCIPIGPASTALLSVMGKLVREKNIDITKNFFKAYKTNFSQSLFVWVLEMIIMAILIIDIKFIISSNYPRSIVIAIFIIMAFVFSISLYVFPIISKFYLKTKDIFEISLYYTIRRFDITILNLFSFIVVGLIFIKVSALVLLFASSIICYLLMLYQKKILLEIEGKLEKLT